MDAYRLEAQAGLFSAVTSALATKLHSQLWPDPGEEPAALLHILIRKLDTAIFGNNVPTVLRWRDSPYATTWIRDVMCAGLAASLFSTSLAMLGKRWLNQHPSPGKRTAGPLPPVPQIPVLLLGCALSQYIWEIDTTVAGVVLDVTSFGVISHFFVLAAGIASKSRLHQLPGLRFLRPACLVIMSAALTVASAFGHAFRHSETVNMFQASTVYHKPLKSGKSMTPFLMDIPCKLPGTLATDAFHLGQTVVQPLVTFACQVYYIRLLGMPSTPAHGLDKQTTLDLKHILWMLRSSLDNTIYLSTLEFLTTMVTLDDFDPTIVVDCFNILTSCTEVVDSTVVITKGLEKLATVSAMCFLDTFSHLSVADPTSAVLGDICQHYGLVFLPEVDFKGSPFYYSLGAIHRLLNSDWRCRQQAGIEWQDYKPSNHEHIIFTHALAKLAQSEYKRREGWEKKVPCWILRFALHSLSLDPQLPTPVLIDCLLIIAIDLGCDVSNTGTITSDERYDHA